MSPVVDRRLKITRGGLLTQERFSEGSLEANNIRVKKSLNIVVLILRAPLLHVRKQALCRNLISILFYFRSEMEKAREEINEFNFKIEKCKGEIKELEKIVSEAEEENNIAKAVEYLEKANRKRKEVRKLVEKQQSKIKDCFEIVRPTVTEEEFEDVITGLEDAIGPTGLAGTEQ